jgi:hypothetical protein
MDTPKKEQCPRKGASPLPSLFFSPVPIFFPTYTVTRVVNLLGKVGITIQGQGISNGSLATGAFTTSGTIHGQAGAGDSAPLFDYSLGLFEGQFTEGRGHLFGTIDYYFGSTPNPSAAAAAPLPPVALGMAPLLGAIAIGKLSRRGTEKARVLL